MTDVLNVTIREGTGTIACKKIRAAGFIPAVLYGHGEANLNLSVPADELEAAIRHGSQMLNLAGGVNESALLSDVQWDGLGSHIMHIDLTRVSASEVVQVTVPLELRGEAPGTHDGGVVELMLHEVELECPAGSIPDKIEISINALELGGAIKIADIEIPEGAKTVGDPDTVAVHCVEPAAEQEAEEGGVSAEPEVIGRKAEDEEEA